MPWVDISEAAFTLGVSERTIRNWIKSGKLQARSSGGRREVEIPDPDPGHTTHAFAEEESEGGQPIEVQKRLEVALIECGRVKGTLASQERMMESLSANIAELNAKLQKSERVIGRRTLWCVIIAFLGVGAYSLSRAWYTSDLQRRSGEHKDEIIQLQKEHMADLEKKETLNRKSMNDLRIEKDKERMSDLSKLETDMAAKHKKAMDALTGEMGARIKRLEEDNLGLRNELDREKEARLKAEAERNGLRKEVENAEARRAETERLVELQKERLKELETTRAELEKRLAETERSRRR